MNRGVTLIEMLIVVAIIALMVGISFPSVSSGLDSLRLITAGDSLVSFLNGALGRAERRQEAIEITISKAANTVILRSSEPGYERRLEMPEGVRIDALLPPSPSGEEESRTFLLYPGGAVPRIGVEIVNRKGTRRIIRLDPIKGIPEVVRVEGR